MGALTALAELEAGPLPFQVVCGVSAGAINGSALAAEADDFHRAVQHLADTWMEAHALPCLPHRLAEPGLDRLGVVPRADLGGVRSHGATTTCWTPSRSGALAKEIDFPGSTTTSPPGPAPGRGGVGHQLRHRHLGELLRRQPHGEARARSRRLGVRGPITVEQVMASAAIPIFFLR